MPPLRADANRSSRRGDPCGRPEWREGEDTLPYGQIRTDSIVGDDVRIVPKAACGALCRKTGTMQPSFPFFCLYSVYPKRGVEK